MCTHCTVYMILQNLCLTRRPLYKFQDNIQYRYLYDKSNICSNSFTIKTILSAGLAHSGSVDFSFNAATLQREQMVLPPTQNEKNQHMCTRLLRVTILRYLCNHFPWVNVVKLGRSEKHRMLSDVLSKQHILFLP